MKQFSTTDKVQVVSLLADGYRLWSDSPVPELSHSQRYIASNMAAQVYRGKHSAEFAAACQCFYLFRKLHTMVEEYPKWATLLGDFFFSQFSKILIPLDNVQLINEFSRFLNSDTQSDWELQNYMDFIKSLPAVMKQ